MTISIGTMTIPQTGSYELDASGNLVPAIVYGASAAMPTQPTSGALTGQATGGYQLNQTMGGGGTTTATPQPAPATPGYSPRLSANPFDNLQPAQLQAPQYAPGSNQVLYGHYSPTGSTQPLTGAELALNGQPPAGSGPSTTAGGAPGKNAPAAKGGGDTAKPKAKPAAEAKPAADKPAAAKTVTVAAGDSLSKLAAKHGGTWQELYAANKGVIGSNPDLIQPGMKLKLP